AGPLMRLTDMFLALPILPLLLVAVLLFRDSLRAALGPHAGIFVLIVVIIGITSWMNTARVVRGEVLALKEREFVTAADALGSGANRIMWTHILPNVMSPILVSASLGMASAIITESALSFLGLGFPPDVPTSGRLLYDGRDYLGITPMRVVWPGMFISLTVLSINFMGDGLRDALDPRPRSRVGGAARRASGAAGSRGSTPAVDPRRRLSEAREACRRGDWAAAYAAFGSAAAELPPPATDLVAWAT